MRSILELYEVATGRVTEVLRHDSAPEDRIEAPNWDPHGGTLLVNGRGALFRVPLDAPALHPLPLGVEGRCNNDHGYSPDGARIAFSIHRGAGSEIFVMSRDGGDAVPVTDDSPSWWHGWSPDGARLAYVAARDGRRVIDVYTIPVAGGPELRLTMGEGHSDGPDYSADGQRLYWNCDRDGHAQIWVMNADGSDQRKLFADDRVNWFPHPSPCGRWLIYLSYPPGTTGHPADLPVQLVLCDPDGGNRRVIREFTGGQGTINVPSWSPDGATFAYMRYEG